MKSRCLAVTGAVAFLLLVPSTARSQEPMQPISGAIRPFTESFRDMLARDEWIAGEIAAGRMPAPPRTVVAGPRRSEEEGEDHEGPRVQPIGPRWPAPQRPKAATRRVDRRPISPLSPQVIGASFPGASSADSIYVPPDTVGGVGPQHVVEAVNCRVLIFDRFGARLGSVGLGTLLQVEIGGVTYPRGVADPRVLYDRRSGRWFISAIETVYEWNQIMLAVSRTSDPAGIWDKYVIPVGHDGHFTDFDTLGVDDNGVYCGFRLFSNYSYDTFAGFVAIRKLPLLQAEPRVEETYVLAPHLDYLVGTPHPAHNYDALAPNGKAWFVSAVSSSATRLRLWPVSWPTSGSPTLGAAQMVDVTGPGPGGLKNMRALGSDKPISVNDGRLTNAMIRNGRLWTARHIGVNANGDDTSESDRVAAEWYEIEVAGPTAALVQTGRIYDDSANNPSSLIYPSICANGQGHAAVGSSIGSLVSYVGAQTIGRLASDPAGVVQRMVITHAGEGPYNTWEEETRYRWGDYSMTCLDPLDDMTLWTFQEYGMGEDTWGTWITQLLSEPPTITSPTQTIGTGQGAVVVTIEGTGFYDPGAAALRGPSVMVGGMGEPNGVSVLWVVVDSPTRARVCLAISEAAALGSRYLTWTNPDGQIAHSEEALLIAKPGTSLATWSMTAAIGQTATLQARLTRDDTGAGVAGKTVRFSIDGADVGSGVSDATGLAIYRYYVSPVLGIDTYGLEADFDGTYAFGSSAAYGTFRTIKGETDLAVPDISAILTQTVALTADLWRTPDGVLLADRTVLFRIDDSTMGSARTNGSGRASLPYEVPHDMPVGSHTIRALFDGDELHSPHFSSGILTVAKAEVIVVIGDVTAPVGTSFDVVGRISRSLDGAPLAGKDVELEIDGTAVAHGASDSNGELRIPCVALEAYGLGDHRMRGGFAGDQLCRPGSGTATLNLTRCETTLSTLDRSGVITTPVILRGYLRRAADRGGIASKLVAFQIDGTAVGTALTDETGRASLSWTVSCSAGAHALSASFEGDSFYGGSAASAVLTATIVTTKTYVPARSGKVKQTALLRAYLYNLGNVGIPAKPLTIRVDGSVVGSGNTDAGGRLQLPFWVPEGSGAGTRAIGGVFGGNAGYTASSGTGALTVLRGDLYIWAYVRSGKRGTVHPLKAYVRSLPDYVIQPGKSISYRVNGTDIGTTTVAATGWAIVNWPIPVGEPTGAHTATVVFAGDAWYNAQSKSTSFNVVP